MSEGNADQANREDLAAVVAAVLTGSRLLVSIAVRSLGAVEDKVGVLPNLSDSLLLPTAAGPEFEGSLLQNLGHTVGGYWGAPIEDGGDALHDVGEAENNVRSMGIDALSGNLDEAGEDVEDVGSDLQDAGENVVNTVTDFF